MLRVTALVLALCVLAGGMGAGPSASAATAGEALPPIDSAGLSGPLKVDELTPAERAAYAHLAPGSDDARRFLYTRGYFRYCRLVATGTIAPLALPPLPIRDNWDRSFISEDEAANVLDVALGMKIRARQVPGPSPVPSARVGDDRLPAVDANGMIAPLRPSQLDADEAARFAELAPGSQEARQFLFTRGYLRYCHLVVDHKLAPLELPKLPAREDWNRAFLTDHEKVEVLDVALGLKIAARMRPPAQ